MKPPKILGQCRQCGSRGLYRGSAHAHPIDGILIVRDGVVIGSTCCNQPVHVVACPYDGHPEPPKPVESGFDIADPDYPLIGLPVYGGPDDGGKFTRGGNRTTGTAYIAEGCSFAPVYELADLLMYDDSPQGWYKKTMYQFTGMYAAKKLA